MVSYCPACAESVTPVNDEAGTPRCPKCTIALTGDLIIEGTPVEPLFGTVLVAEDTRLITEILKEGLVSEGLAQHVFAAEDGREFVRLYAEFLYHDRPVDLAIVDLQMPVLDGSATAVAMRAMEQGCQKRPATIIFFTSHPITDNIRSLIRYCRPAHYLNKGADASPPRIIKRLREVMKALTM